MKFYEKIIMIDSQSHSEREFLLQNDYIRVPATIDARKGISLGYIDTYSQEYMTFDRSFISLSRDGSDDYDVFRLGRSGSGIRLDFDNYMIDFSGEWDLDVKSLRVNDIRPESGVSGTLGTNLYRWPEIWAKDINSTTADITTADITNLTATNILSSAKWYYSANPNRYSDYTIAGGWQGEGALNVSSGSRATQIRFGSVGTSSSNAETTVTFNPPFSSPWSPRVIITPRTLVESRYRVSVANPTQFVIRFEEAETAVFDWVAITSSE